MRVASSSGHYYSASGPFSPLLATSYSCPLCHLHICWTLAELGGWHIWVNLLVGSWVRNRIASASHARKGVVWALVQDSLDHARLLDTKTAAAHYFLDVSSVPRTTTTTTTPISLFSLLFSCSAFRACGSACCSWSRPLLSSSASAASSTRHSNQPRFVLVILQGHSRSRRRCCRRR